MFRIDGPGAVGELPPVREGVSNPGYFGPGNPATGQMSTRVTYEWLNAVQEELTAVIRAAKLDLDKHDNSQLLTALGELTVGPGSVFTPPTASEDGKAGLVPAPHATSYPTNNLLSVGGFKEVDLAFMHGSAESPELAQNRLCLGGVSLNGATDCTMGSNFFVVT